MSMNNLTLKNLSTVIDPSALGSVRSIPVSLLDEFTDHPFKVEDDRDMAALVTSIERMGIREPLLVRGKGDRFEVISGHRRLHAARLLEIPSVPCVVVDLDDDDATVLMVDANLSRTHLSVKEKARAYALRYQALKHQGREGGSTRAKVAVETGESSAQVARLIRLDNLSDDLLDAIDAGRMGIRPALRLCGLDPDEQHLISAWLDKDPARSLSDRLAALLASIAETEELSAQRIEELAEAGRTTASKPVRVDPLLLPAWVREEDRAQWVCAAIEEYARNHPDPRV
jgi:ParB family chromosome partitioning protein